MQDKEMTVTLIWASQCWNYKPRFCCCGWHSHHSCCLKMQKGMPDSVVSRQTSSCTHAALSCGRFCGSVSTDGPSVYFGVINGGGDDEQGQTCQWYQGNGNLHRRKPLFYGIGFGNQESQKDLLMRHHIYSAVDWEKRRCNARPVCSHHWKQMTAELFNLTRNVNHSYTNDDCREGKDSREIKRLKFWRGGNPLTTPLPIS